MGAPRAPERQHIEQFGSEAQHFVLPHLVPESHARGIADKISDSEDHP